MIYLLTTEDKHADPEHTGFNKLCDAKRAAEDSLDESMGYYGLNRLDMDTVACDGEDGWWYSTQSLCGSFNITIREVEIK